MLLWIILVLGRDDVFNVIIVKSRMGMFGLILLIVEDGGFVVVWLMGLLDCWVGLVGVVDIVVM